MPDSPTAVLDRLSPAQRLAVTRYADTHGITPEQAVPAIAAAIATALTRLREALKTFVDDLVTWMRGVCDTVARVHDAMPLWWHTRTRSTFHSCPFCSDPEPGPA